MPCRSSSQWKISATVAEPMKAPVVAVSDTSTMRQPRRRNIGSLRATEKPASASTVVVRLMNSTCLTTAVVVRSEEHTSEPPVTNAQLVCRLLLEKKHHTSDQQ